MMNSKNNFKKAVIVFYIYLLVVMGTIAIVAVCNINIPWILPILFVFAPAVIAIFIAYIYLNKDVLIANRFIKSNTSIINQYLNDNIKINNHSINPLSTTGKIFEGFFYHSYNLGKSYTGKNYYFYNVYMFTYDNINDERSNKNKVFNGMLLKLNTNRYFQEEKYLISKNFFPFDATKLFFDGDYNKVEYPNAISITKSSDDPEWNKLISKINFNIDYPFALYANKNDICIVLEDFSVYSLPHNFSEDDAITVIQRDSQKIKYIIDLLQD